MQSQGIEDNGYDSSGVDRPEKAEHVEPPRSIEHSVDEREHDNGHLTPNVEERPTEAESTPEEGYATPTPDTVEHVRPESVNSLDSTEKNGPAELERVGPNESSNAPPTSPLENHVVEDAHVQEVEVPYSNGQHRDSSAAPTPIEKSPPLVQSAESSHSPRPSTPLTARLFGRKSTSDSVHSPPPITGHARKLTMSQGNTVSTVLISTALETIAASREAKRSAPLKEAVDKALTMLRAGEGGDKPREIFEPLRLACETQNEKLQIASLDCISKLISHSFFLEPDARDRVIHHISSPPASPSLSAKMTGSQANLGQPSLVDIVTHTITACHSESAPDTVSLQIVKALLALVLSSSLLVHQSSLLKAVRTVYNIFLLSPDPVNQTVAQGGLTQMVHHVFSRVNLSNFSRGNSVDESSPHSSRPQSSLRHSSRPSQTPSTPETYPLPPLTPPSSQHPHDDEAVEPAHKDDVEAAVADPAVIREADIQSPAPERATLCVSSTFYSSIRLIVS
jgi:brefeldin A-inhibited guanine nucleotide-exchange protein